jgi:CRISPR-associated protein Cas1
MIKRTIEISGLDVSLRVSNRQILVYKNNEQINQIPAEDIGVLIIDAPTTQYSHETVVILAEMGACIVFCDGKHLPAAMMLPIAANNLRAKRIQEQATMKETHKRKLWQQIIRHKICWQAANMSDARKKQELLAIASRVQLGDKKNAEARAAKIYWKNLFPGHVFRRDQDGEPPNNLLNYGYMVIRAAVARALCGAGLCVSLGIKHSNQYNIFCLADDFMEVFRPLVDREVKEIWTSGNVMFSQETKKRLLSLLTATVTFENQQGPLLIALERVAAGFVGTIENESDKLVLPVLWK